MRGSLRATYEALPFLEQFRLTAAAAVVAAVLLFQLVGAAWDMRRTHREALDLAESRVSAMAARLEQAGGGALDDLSGHPQLLSAAFSLEGGQILQRYTRDGHARARAPVWASKPPGWWYRLRSSLALAPIYVGSTVRLGPQLSGNVNVIIDHRYIWRAAWARLVQTPLALLLAALAVWFATGALRRNLGERIVLLAEEIAVDAAGRGGRPGRFDVDAGLAAVSTRFQAMKEQMTRYERDLVETRHAAGRRILERTREIEEKLRKSEAVMRSKDEFLANMSHEIRTPMNGVLGMAELLAGTELDKRQRRFVDSMRAAAETMMQIINDILDDSKIQAGKMDLVLEPFDVRELVEQAAQLYAGRAERKKLEMICRIEPTVPSVVMGDLLRIRQVLGNLLSNAVKYTESGEVELRVGLDDLRDDQCRLHFSIRDTGPGIAAHDQSGVFQAFTQLGGSSRLGGTGLGLSIANRLVRLMGGEKIELRSEVGRGSTFSIVLPFEVREAAPVPNAASDEFSGLRVLVVDDNSTSLLLLDEMMSNWSAEVTPLNRARAAVERLRQAATRERAFDVLVLDHSLPDAPTEEVLRTIRLEPALAQTYVVLLSALGFDASFEDGRAIAPDATIGKPVRQQLLHNALAASRQPRIQAVAEPRRPESGPAPDLQRTASLGLRVLVADDNAINREVAVAMLEILGCSAVLASDGRDAVTEARRQRFDVILMDCQMPQMDGYAATAAIRSDEARRGLAATPIIALTANVMARDRERCLAAGMNGFLAKPFKAEQLAEILEPIAAARAATEPQSRAETPAAVAEAVSPATAVVMPAQTAPVIDLPQPAEPPDDDPLLSDAEVASVFESPVSSNDSAVRLLVLDPEQVLAIRGLGKPQLFERLCDALFGSASEALARIDAALADNRFDDLAEAAHALKSPVANLGGRRLAEMLERCETLARSGGDGASLRRLATGLKPHYAALVAALQAEMRRAAAG
jgi:signal transduction histidine kinase/CheY-like chemotaxis protein/HPt (histidine-containing phosphotransfer) domain-containing protein